jgi:DNA repair exonuclease SbcCD ATPase subunit
MSQPPQQPQLPNMLKDLIAALRVSREEAKAIKEHAKMSKEDARKQVEAVKEEASGAQKQAKEEASAMRKQIENLCKQIAELEAERREMRAMVEEEWSIVNHTGYDLTNSLVSIADCATDREAEAGAEGK